MKKADVGISHQTENEKGKFVYVPGTYISPFVAALAAGVNSNPSILLVNRGSKTGSQMFYSGLQAPEKWWLREEEEE